jgi:hypothetical protein
LLLQQDFRVNITRIGAWGKIPDPAIVRLLNARPVADNSDLIQGRRAWLQKGSYLRAKPDEARGSWVLPFRVSTFCHERCIVSIQDDAPPKTELMKVKRAKNGTDQRGNSKQYRSKCREAGARVMAGSADMNYTERARLGSMHPALF